MPDWLSEAAPVEAVASEQPDWLSAMPADEPEVDMAPAAEMPDWLSEAAPVEAVASEQPDWLSEMPADEPEVDMAPAAEMPDWMSEAAPVEAVASEVPPQEEYADMTGFAPVAETAAESGPDWLMAMQPEDDELDAVEAVGPEWSVAIDESPLMDANSDLYASEVIDEPALSMEQPDWLNAMTAGPDETPAVDMPLASEVETPDWASAFDAPSMEPATLSSESQPDWLQMMGDEEAQAPLEDIVPEDAPLPAIRSAQTIDLSETEFAKGFEITEPELNEPAAAMEWLSETGNLEDSMDQAVTADADWLSEMQAAAQEPVPDEAIQAVTPDWLSGMEPDMMDADQIADPEWPAAEPVAELDDLLPMDSIEDVETARVHAVMDASEDQMAYDWDDSLEETAPAAPLPAANAPDWLNAMVPGLDVDPSAEEDAPLESEFMPGSENRVTAVLPVAQPKPTPEYNWVNEIVQEETQPVQEVDVAVAGAGAGKSRFSFSRLPKWLQGKPAEDMDLPPWLR
jgi:hypothetical protein